MRFLRLVVPPAVEPVTLEEAKLHLRIDGNGEDNLILALIAAARQKAEEYTRRAFITQTWDLVLDSVSRAFYLPRPPVQAIDAVTLDGEAVASENYALVGQAVFFAKVQLNAVNPGGLVIQYTSGYGNAASDVPQEIRQAILMLVAYLYEHRGDEVIELPPAFKEMLRPYRVVLL